MSIFEEEEKIPKNITVKRLLSGLFDLSVILALKTLSDIAGNNYEFIVLIYYFLSFAILRTTAGGAILDTKAVMMNEEKSDLDIKFAILRSLVISIIIASIYYIYTSQTGILKYALPLVLVIAIIAPIFFTKGQLTIHDYLSKTQIVINKDKDKSLIKESIVILTISFSIISFIAVNTYYTQIKCKKLMEENNYVELINTCKFSAQISNDKEQYYKLGIAFLKQNEAPDAIKYLSKAEELGKEEAAFAIIKSHILNDDLVNAEEQAIKLIKDLSSSLVMSNTLMQRYRRLKDSEDLFAAYIYLYIYGKIYNEITLDKSILSKGGQKEILTKYYPVSQKYIEFARSKLSEEDIMSAEEEANAILSENEAAKD